MEAAGHLTVPMEHNLQPRQAVRFIGGKYNGFQGTTQWVGDLTASVIVVMDTGAKYELIEDTKFLQDLKEWQSARGKTELALKSNA
jgi:hypothetical protein